MLETPANALENARLLVADLQARIGQIQAIEPCLYEIPPLGERLAAVGRSLTNAAKRLERPTLRIAMIGTTSAGKSTLVNALIGRQVAPMEADEMSAGVLHFVHSERRRLVVDHAEHACWDALDIYDVEDCDIYVHIKERVFRPYHMERQKRTVPVPLIRVEGPLLPMNWPGLMDMLPLGGGLEILDLPGLNSVQDRENLRIIQSQLKSCFSVVMLDYSHTDRQSREKLLNKVKQVVEALGGRIDTLLFVVNRVDLRNQHDDPLEERLDRLSEEIAAKLELQVKPSLIPVSALPLFYAQSAWGYTAPFENSLPLTSIDHQIQCFRDFRRDCAGLITEHQDKDDDVADWFYKMRKASALSVEDLRTWVRWSWGWSQGEKILTALKERIEERLPEVVIAPILMEALADLNALIVLLLEYCDNQKISSRDELEKKRRELATLFAELKGYVEEKGYSFREEMVKYMTDLGSSDVEVLEKAIKELSKYSGDSMLLRRALRDTTLDLREKIINPIVEYYEKELPDNVLKEKLDCIPAECRDNLCMIASKYRAKGMAGNAVIKGLNEKCKDTDSQNVAKINALENTAHCLFRAVREAVAIRAGFVLQAKGPLIEEALNTMVNKEIEHLQQAFIDKAPEISNTLNALFCEKRAHTAPMTLAPELFSFSRPEQKNEKTKEKVGTKQELYRYTTGSCFKETHTGYKTVDRYDDINYKVLNLPNARDMAKLWEKGISEAGSELWKAFAAWIKESVSEQITQFLQAADEANLYLGILLDQRLQQTQEEYECRQARLESLEEELSLLVGEMLQLKEAQYSKAGLP